MATSTRAPQQRSGGVLVTRFAQTTSGSTAISSPLAPLGLTNATTEH